MTQNQPNPSLSRSQERALAELISQPTIPLAAAASKVSTRTIYRWLEKDAAFKSEYLSLRREIVNNAVLQLQKACNNAVNVTIELMNDPETPASVRLGAARATLELSLEFLKVEALEEKIAELERKLEEFDEYRSKAGTNAKGHTLPTR